jgi:hypothetical protein
MERQQCGRAYPNGDLADPSDTQKERPDSADEPIAHAEVRRTLSRAAQHDQLLLAQEILSDHGSHAARSTALRGRDGQVKQGEQQVLHARTASVRTQGPCNVAPVLDSLENREFETHRWRRGRRCRIIIRTGLAFFTPIRAAGG